MPRTLRAVADPLPLNYLRAVARALLIALALCLLAPAAAAAGVVRAVGGKVLFEPKPGATYNVELEAPYGRFVHIRIRGGEPIEARWPDCFYYTREWIHCNPQHPSRLDRVEARLADGNDKVLVAGYWKHFSIDAGGGDDRVDAFEGGQTVYGDSSPGDKLDGAGPFTVHGGPGDDVVTEAPGNPPAASELFGDDGNDRLASARRRAKLDGGEGNDAATGAGDVDGGPGRDRLTSVSDGDGRDPVALRGGPGDDELIGGPPRDELMGGSGADTISGGDGVDAVSHEDRPEGVHLDLSDGSHGGLSQEGDLVADDVERVRGTAHNDVIAAGHAAARVEGGAGFDVLVGGAADDHLNGGPHADLVLGGPGADVLSGGGEMNDDPLGTGPGVREDTIDGGPGDDRIGSVANGDWVTGSEGDDWIDMQNSSAVNHSHVIPLSGADQGFCGDGDDSVLADYGDDVAPDCERVSEGTPRWRELKVRPKRPVRLTVRCAWRDDRPCKGTAWLRTVAGLSGPAGGDTASDETREAAPARCRMRAGVTLGEARFRIRAGRVNYVYFDLPSRTTRLLRARGCVAVQAVLAFIDVRGREWNASRSLTLKLAGVSRR